MNIFYTCLVLFLAATTATYCQTTISIGPYAAPKIGLNISSQPDLIVDDPFLGRHYVTSKGQSSYDIDFGISLKVDLEHLKSTLFFDGGYTSTSTSFLLSDDKDGSRNFTTRVNYLTISPNYAAKWFFMGLTFGLPISATTSNSAGTVNIDADITDNLRMKADLKMGCLFPLVKNDLGELDVFVTTALMIPPLFMDDPLPSPEHVILDYSSSYYENNSPRIFSCSLGLTYYFNALKTD
ncbi:MAG: hypothetical protein U0264_19200 [Candidatus Kapaibacterium sp.]